LKIFVNIKIKYNFTKKIKYNFIKKIKKRMKTKFVLNILLLLNIIILVGCIENPQFVGIRNFEIIGATDTNILSKVSVEVFNPNKTDLYIDSFAYNAFINKQIVGRGTSITHFLLISNSNSVFDNNISINLKDLTSVFEYINLQDTIKVDFEVFAKFSKLKIGVKEKMSVSILKKDLLKYLLNPEALKDAYKIKNVSLESITMEQTIFNVVIELKNPFPLSYTLKEYNIDFYNNEMKDKKIGDCKDTIANIIKSNEKLDLKMQVKIENSNAITSLFGNVIKQDFSFYLSGKMKVIFNDNEFEIPINQKVSKNDF